MPKNITPNKHEMPPQIRHQTTYFRTPVLCVAGKEIREKNFNSLKCEHVDANQTRKDYKDLRD